MSIQKLLESYQNKLSELDRTILNSLLELDQKILGYTIIELAETIHCSKSSILRLCKKLGFSGFSEFKYYLKQQEKPVGSKNLNILSLQQKDIQDTLKALYQTNFAPILATLYQANNVYCYGTGFSQKNALQEFCKSLLSCNKRALVMPAKTELDLNMPLFTQNDLVVFGSLSGETEAIKENLRLLQLRKIPILSLTRFNQNTLASQADFNLFYFVSSLGVVGKSQKIESLVTMNITLDALFRKYIEFLNQQ